MANTMVGAFLITSTTHRGDKTSLPIGAGQGHVETTSPPAQESLPPPQPNLDQSNQSLPLLEVMLEDEESYEASLMSDTQDNVARGWSRVPQKYRVIILGSVLVAMTAIIAVAMTFSGSPIIPVSKRN